MNEIENYNEKIFEEIKHIDENGNEYWFARELMPLLEYSKWENFNKVIKKALISYHKSNNDDTYWLPEVRKPIITGKGKEEFIIDYKLSRYICYLIVQNANPKKKMVALGQTYFAIQTRKMEITEEEYENLRFQSGPSSIKEYSVHRYNSYIFTEHDVAITSMLINFFIGGKIFGIKSR